MTNNTEALKSMSLTAHFLELRKRIVLILLGLICCTIALSPFTNTLFEYFSKPLMQALPQGAQLLSVSVIAPVLGPLKILLFCAFCLSLPFAVYQIWMFLSPALFKKEKKFVIPLVISSLLMFASGVAYCYFVVFGFLFTFIASFSPDAINFAPDIDSYLSFVLHMFIAFGATFEVPVAVTLLASMNVVSLEKLKKFRRYLIVVAFAIAAVLTPPDIASQLLLALPIIILYEVGIVIATIFCRRKESLPKEDLA
ncbi:MAG: twin-arginine translocase subunit TatC [Succinivibrio sp.]|nr:twin-arginine translocase subunit TatC [Succinivibrio sp.]